MNLIQVVTCGRAGFQNSRNQVSVVQLKVTLPSDHTRKTDTVLEGRRYKLRAEVLDHDRKNFEKRVKKCHFGNFSEWAGMAVPCLCSSQESLSQEFKKSFCWEDWKAKLERVHFSKVQSGKITMCSNVQCIATQFSNLPVSVTIQTTGPSEMRKQYIRITCNLSENFFLFF